MTLPDSVDATLALLRADGYVAERSLATALYLALTLDRPLFLEGLVWPEGPGCMTSRGGLSALVSSLDSVELVVSLVVSPLLFLCPLHRPKTNQIPRISITSILLGLVEHLLDRIS